MDKCVFCDSELNPGSVEHLFPSAIGGRVTTRRATCTACNNSFSSKETEAVDEDLSATFIHIRNALKIWSGRDGPPPTLKRVQVHPDGAELDLAPGLVPVTRPGKLPETSLLTPGTSHKVVASTPEDAKRLLGIAEKRGVAAKVERMQSVRRSSDVIPFEISLKNDLLCRAIAKIAIVACCVFFGNENARAKCSVALRNASRYGKPDAMDFGGVDFTNPWPAELALTAHPNTPDAVTSGFEHSVIVCDVGDVFVAYVELFGAFRFSVALAPAAGLAPRGLAVNPRSSRPARFEVAFEVPKVYRPKTAASFKEEHAESREGVSQAFSKALEVWSREAHEQFDAELGSELQEALEAIGDDEERRTDAIAKYAMRLAANRMGIGWAEEIDLELNADGDIVPSPNAKPVSPA